MFNWAVTPMSPPIETRIGQVDIKSSPVHFYVLRLSTINAVSRPLPFQVERLNIGSGMNTATGVFTAPKAGVYVFAFKAMCSGLLTTDGYSGYGQTRLMHNGVQVARGQTVGYEPAPATMNGLTIAIHATLKLNTSDTIYISLDGGSLYDSATMHTHFTGSLLEEDLGIA